MTDYSSKARMSTTLAFRTLETGRQHRPVLFSDPHSYSTARFGESRTWWKRGDDLWLTRVGLDPNGALQMYNALTTAFRQRKENTHLGRQRTI